MSLSKLLKNGTPIMIGGSHLSDEADIYGTALTSSDVTETTGILQAQGRTEREGYIPSGNFLLVVPADTTIAADDTVIADGAAYAVQGPPAKVRNDRTGVVSHIEATLVQTRGGLEEGS